MQQKCYCKYYFVHHYHIPEYGPAPCVEGELYGFQGYCREVACGGTMYAMSGVLQSPYWPDPAPFFQLCQWAIVLPNTEANIAIVVEDIDINPGRGGNCFWDYLMIFDTKAQDGTIPPTLGDRMCGTTPPAGQMIATGNVVHVWYNSRDLSNKGFSILFSAIV